MRNKLSAIALLMMMLLGLAYAQDQSPARSSKVARSSESKDSKTKSPAGGAYSGKCIVTPMAAGPSLQVLGSGTIGRLPKWTGFTSSNSFIGDSSIFEDKNGFIGIGTAPTSSKLTVAGTIQSLAGGFKFPDGTTQTTAGIAPSQVVGSLNGLMGDLSLVPGANITITPGANTLTIGATGLLSAVNHDETLKGNGTSASPLGVNVPLILTGTGVQTIIEVTNDTSIGIRAKGGISSAGVVGSGGDNDSGEGGEGMAAFGGSGRGMGNSGGIGIRATGGNGFDGATPGLAGKFIGDVEVTGTLSKGGGSFKIDHPLDPENRYLYHSFVESPDMKNIYDGTVTTDEDGEAVVTLPDYFEALNSDFRYQLTVIGTFAQAIVSQKIKNNRFVIMTNAPNVEVSWQVTGIRRDAWANKNRIKVEEEKPERERGHYLHPEAYDQPEERGVEWARSPELMKQRKESMNAEKAKLRLEKSLQQ